MSIKYTNQLIHETSPYLLQHAHNPVNWYPWGDEAIEKAKNENKLILVSIGYSACHWCHVMERESFENEEIAQIMNDNFVCIKVDREERPDIDHIYMNAVQIIAGNGGWPLNCFALPDGRPVYGGTYFRPKQWKDILENLAFGYKTDDSKFLSAASDIEKGIKSINKVVKIKEEKDFSFEEILDTIIKLRRNFDQVNGGTYGAPKFPLPINYFPLIRFYYHSNDKDILKYINLSLEKMANGGIYDQLGGGFARYSVDKLWLVPHFEKMLYDNAQLISLYSEAYRMNANEKFKQIVLESVAFLEKEMISPEGGFYSAYDADSEGVEGKYYVWDKSEVDFLLKDKSEVFCKYYDITESGNWDGRNILNVKKNIDDFAAENSMSSEELKVTINECKQILYEQRVKRVKPGLDDKILTSWNALTIKALVDSYIAFDKEEYLHLAERAIGFIEEKLLGTDFSLKRSYKTTINAFLDDYAILIEAYLALYQATFKINYINKAKELLKYTLEHFYDSTTGMFYYTSNLEDEIVTRSIETMDNVIPSSNSIMAQNLFKLGHFFLIQEYIDISKQMLLNVISNLEKSPSFYGNWFDLLIQFVYKPYEVVIMGENFKKNKRLFNKIYLPNVIFAGGENESIPILQNRFVESNSIIYVCKNNVCNRPVKSVEEALNQIQNN